MNVTFIFLFKRYIDYYQILLFDNVIICHINNVLHPSQTICSKEKKTIKASEKQQSKFKSIIDQSSCQISKTRYFCFYCIF